MGGSKVWNSISMLLPHTHAHTHIHTHITYVDNIIMSEDLEDLGRMKVMSEDLEDLGRMKVDDI